jgi:hypothetical protein
LRTRILTRDVTPSLHLDYKNTKVKQYHKEGRALRTETTINNTRDFGIGKGLHNLPALRQVGFQANRRLLDVQTINHDPIRGATALTQLTGPIIHPNGTRIAGLRFGDPRVNALLQAICTHRLQPYGFNNRDLRQIVAPLLGKKPGDISPGQMTYDLRRLREHGLIHRIPHTHRYEATETGYAQALFLVHAHAHLLRTGLANLSDPAQVRTPLAKATRDYRDAFTTLTRQAHLAAA